MKLNAYFKRPALLGASVLILSAALFTAWAEFGFDSDNDGLTDIEEEGTIEEGVNEAFLWYDTTGAVDILAEETGNTDDNFWTVPLFYPVVMDGILQNYATIDMNGIVYLQPTLDLQGFPYSWYDPQDLASWQYSLGHIAIAAYWTDLYKRASVNTEIRVADIPEARTTVIEYRNVSRWGTAYENETATFQIILPESSTNLFYVSYLDCTPALNEVTPILGVQNARLYHPQYTNSYYNLTYSANITNAFPAGTTLTYRLGHWTDPLNVDTDNDGLSDYVEVRVTHTEPLIADTDNDGISDGWEIEFDLNPLSPDDAAEDPDQDGLTNLAESIAQTDPFNADSDNDGLSDGWEVLNNLDPLSATSTQGADGDPDQDGLTNAEEYTYQTCPTLADTDGDGLSDSAEIGLISIPSTFQWYDTTNATNILAGLTGRIDDNFWSFPLERPILLNSVLHDEAIIDMNGIFYLKDDSFFQSFQYSWYDPQDLNTWSYSLGNVALAPFWTDLAHRESLTTEIRLLNSPSNDVTVIEYKNASLWGTGFEEEALTCQVIIPHTETNVVYMSYQSATPHFATIAPTLGVQLANLTDPYNPENYYNLTYSCGETNAFPAGVTVKYQIGHCTDPTKQDTDNDGLADGEEVYTYTSDPLTADTDGDGLSDGIEANLTTSPTNPDTDGDGLPDGWEVQYGLNPCSAEGLDGAEGDPDLDGLNNEMEYILETNPIVADTDGDGLPDGWEFTYYLDPLSAEGVHGANGDYDQDGMTNLSEYTNQSNPTDIDGNGQTDMEEIPTLNSPTEDDSDGDGISDEEEIEQGTNPLDATDVYPVFSVSLTGNLPQDVTAYLGETKTLLPQSTYLVMIFIGSEEYLDENGFDLEHDDELTWEVKQNGKDILSGDFLVQSEWATAEEARANGWRFPGFCLTIPKAAAIVKTGNSSELLSFALTATNKGDGQLASTVMVKAYPLNVIQSNMPPVSQSGPGSTDLATPNGRQRYAAVIPKDGVAYITGEPAPPQLTAKFQGFPDWLHVEWKGALTTERKERRKKPNNIDSRSLGVATNNVYEVTTALNDEIIGGACTLQFTVLASTNRISQGEFPFFIRGKNPLDVAVTNYISQVVEDEFKSYAWMIAKHETIDGVYCYNQFNAIENEFKGLPNKTKGKKSNGWGIGQIDFGSNRVDTAILYNWRTNVVQMSDILKKKRDTYERFIGHYEAVYVQDEGQPWTWIDPESVVTNIKYNAVSTYEVSMRQWGILTLYNGVPKRFERKVNGHTIKTPVHFDSAISKWKLFANGNDYVFKVVRDAFLKEAD